MGAVKRARMEVESRMISWLARQLNEPESVVEYEFDQQRRRPDGMEIEDYITSRTKK